MNAPMADDLLKKALGACFDHCKSADHFRSLVDQVITESGRNDSISEQEFQELLNLLTVFRRGLDGKRASDEATNVYFTVNRKLLGGHTGLTRQDANAIRSMLKK